MTRDNKAKLELEQWQARRPSLIINAITNWVAFGLNVTIVFLLTPFIISKLGKTGYGIWVLITSFIGYYGLLNLGVRSALMRYIARYAGQGDIKSLNETMSTVIVTLSFMGAVTIGSSFVLARPLASFFDIAPEHLDVFKYVVWVLGSATGLTLPGSTFGAVLMAHEKYVAANSSIVLNLLVRTVLTVVMLLRGHGLLGVAYADFIATISGITANYLFYRKLVPWVQFSFKGAKCRVLGMLLIYGSFAAVGAVANLMRFSLGNFVVGKWVGIAEVGIYGIAALLIRYMFRLLALATDVLKPRFAALDGTRDYVRLKNLFLRSLSISALLSFGASMLVVIFGGRFIYLWVGEEFTRAIPVLWILAVAYGLGLSQQPGLGLIYALNKHRSYAIATVFEGIVNFSLSLLLALKYGIIGVALGTVIPMLTVKLVFLPIYIVRITGISYLEYTKPLGAPVITSLIMIISAYNLGIIQNWTGSSLFELVALGILTSLIYLVAVMFLTKDSTLTLKIGELLRKKRYPNEIMPKND